MKPSSGITLNDVRQEALNTIRDLRSGTIDVKTAGEIRNLCNTVIDVAKTQVEFLKSLPEEVKKQMKVDEVKAIAGTLRDRDAEMDVVMTEIEGKQNHYEIKNQ